MEWLEQWNNALDYLEEHLTGELDIAKAAQTACCSVFHFQRMFSYLAGVPLSEYLRRRRMTARRSISKTGTRCSIPRCGMGTIPRPPSTARSGAYTGSPPPPHRGKALLSGPIRGSASKSPSKEKRKWSIGLSKKTPSGSSAMGWPCQGPRRKFRGGSGILEQNHVRPPPRFPACVP